MAPPAPPAPQHALPPSFVFGSHIVQARAHEEFQPLFGAKHGRGNPLRHLALHSCGLFSISADLSPHLRFQKKNYLTSEGEFWIATGSGDQASSPARSLSRSRRVSRPASCCLRESAAPRRAAVAVLSPGVLSGNAC